MGITNGKWMLFPGQSDLARVWRVVATATSNGKLGPTSKVGTLDPTAPNTLICIYTYDFSDFEDVRRVLNDIVSLGICHTNGKPIYYKCDAPGHLLWQFIQAEGQPLLEQGDPAQLGEGVCKWSRGEDEEES